MAIVRPFRALRFTSKAGDIRELTCPPYDIISEEQRQAYLKRNPYNIIRLELPRDGEAPYEAAGKTLNAWLEDGILRQDEREAFYLYEIEFTIPGRDSSLSVSGLIAQVQLEEFSKGVVLPHEETLSKAKADRFQLMQATGCNFSDIYSLYPDNDPEGRVASLLADAKAREPLTVLTDEEGLTHRLWAILDPTDTALIQRQFSNTKLYIADGHHRYETALNYRNAMREQGVPEGSGTDYVMMMLVPMSHPGLVVFPTHRMVRGVKGFSPSKLISECEEYFEVREEISVDALQGSLDEAYRRGKKAFGFYTGGEKASLLILKDTKVMDRLLPELSPVSRQLDVNVLHTLILERLLGIDKENMANQKSLTYTRSRKEALESVESGQFQCSFLLNPTRVEEIREVAAAGEKMPQKSTYFYPKLITGLTMNKLV